MVIKTKSSKMAKVKANNTPEGVKENTMEQAEVKRGPGRPRKDATETKEPSEKKYPFRAAASMAFMFGANIETYNRSQDNSKATTFVDMGEKGSFLMIEDGDQIAIFQDAVRCERRPAVFLETMKNLGFIG